MCPPSQQPDGQSHKQHTTNTNTEHIRNTQTNKPQETEITNQHTLRYDTDKQNIQSDSSTVDLVSRYLGHCRLTLTDTNRY